MKFYPAELPLPLQSGYTSQHRPNMIRTQMADGYTRQRLINQGAPDTVQVQLIIDESQYRDMLTWYKADIRSGQDWFVMPLLRESAGDSATEYRCVRMQGGEFSAAVVSTNPHRGTIYRISLTLDVSNTIVDDGSWEDHYLPDVSVGGEVGALSNAEGSRIADIDSVIEEDADTGAGIGNVTTTESASEYDEV